ncbi:competence protein CoiA, partial [Brevibacillus laterosporus]
NKTINSLIHTDEFINLLARKKMLYCPICNNSVIYRNGSIRRKHFAHVSKCSYQYHEPETIEHLNGKVLLYNWLKHQPFVTNLKLESWIPETKQKPDIYFEMNKQRYAIEYQCSPITVKKIKERMNLYSVADICDIWIFGTAKYSPEKPKSTEKYLKSLRKNVYYFDSKTALLYKNSLSNTQSLNDTNNLHFYKGKLFTNYDVTLKFQFLLRKIMCPISDYERQVIKNQYIANLEETLAKEIVLKRKRKEQVEKDRIDYQIKMSEIALENATSIIKGRRIILYDEYEVYKTQQKNLKFKHYALKKEQLDYGEIYNFLLDNCNSAEIHLFIPCTNFNLKSQRVWFSKFFNSEDTYYVFKTKKGIIKYKKLKGKLYGDSQD